MKFFTIISVASSLLVPICSGRAVRSHMIPRQGTPDPIYTRGPVITTNFPDPGLIQYQGIW